MSTRAGSWSYLGMCLISQRKMFISGLPVSFEYIIEFDEPRSLEEAIRKLRHFYEEPKHKINTKLD